MEKIPSNTTGQNATEEPYTAGGNYDSATGLYTETTGAGYIWKYMYTIPTDDVLKFLIIRLYANRSSC